MRFDIKIAEFMLKFISRVCTKHRGLSVTKYSRLNGTITYKLEWHDC